MNVTRATVFLVDDNPRVLTGLRRVLRSSPYATRAFRSGLELLECQRPPGPACAVVELKLPDMNGLEVQQRLGGSGIEMPVIFLTGFGDIGSAVDAMKCGAVDFLTKPVDDVTLLAAIRRAIARDVARQADRRRASEAARRVRSLTRRECEVLRGVLAGMLNKQIAAAMGITEKTVKVHRGRVMGKMQVRSVAELVPLASAGGVEGKPARSRHSFPASFPVVNG